MGFGGWYCEVSGYEEIICTDFGGWGVLVIISKFDVQIKNRQFEYQ